MDFSRRHWDLIRLLAARRFAERYQGTLFGWIWLVMGPVLTIALLSFVFGTLLQVRWDIEPDIPYPVVLFSGLVVHFFLSECLIRSPNLVLERPEFVHQLAFPLATVAVIHVLDVVGAFLAGFVVFLLIAFAVGFTPTTNWLLLPIALLPLVFYGLAFGWGLSAIGVYVRDLNQVGGQLSTGFLLFSPILYPLSSVPEGLRGYYYLNPATSVVNNVRTIVFSNTQPSLEGLFFPCLASVFVAGIGYLIFNKLKNGFSDVV